MDTSSEPCRAHDQLSISSTVVLLPQSPDADQTGWKSSSVLPDSAVPWTELLGALLLSLAASAQWLTFRS